MAIVAACGHAAAPPPALERPELPRLLPPPPADPAARGAPYLARVALQLQPGWGQFLDDCRLRLPAKHPLNEMSLAAQAELAVDRAGRVVEVTLRGSGNADFDHAVRDAITDAAPLAAPPPELLSDDDRLHLRWLFARDRRQAGPATAEVVALELPLAAVVDRWIREANLARAARRLARAPAGAERTKAIERVMKAALHEAIGSADSAVRRAAVDAIRRARVGELADDVRGELAATADLDLRVLAMLAAVELDRIDDGHAQRGRFVNVLVGQLGEDLPAHPRLALAEVRALADLHAEALARPVIVRELSADAPSAVALEALAFVELDSELRPSLARWFQHGDARTRAGVCAAAGALPLDAGWKWIAAGLRDPDATVRARCIEAVPARRDPRVLAAVPRLRELARDRDRTVRAHALTALVALDPAHPIAAADDPAAEVRAAYAAALAVARTGEGDAALHALIDDRDADVRAAAWSVLAAAPVAPADRAQLAARAASDSAAQVRRAALPAVDDDELLARLAAGDDSPEVRTEALVQLAARRGRLASEPELLDRLAAAPPGGAERVRAALAWLLAR